MSLKLYYGPGACSFVPHALLEACGAAYEPMLVKLHRGEQQSEAYKAMNPRGQVPVLVDGDQVVTQILAIIGYIHDRYPQAQLLPSEALARAKVMELLAWMNNTVHPTFTHYFMPQKFTDQPAVHDELKRYSIVLYRQQLAEIEALAARMHHSGGSFLAQPLGQQDCSAGFGPLDVYALTLLRWGSLAGIDPSGYPQLWAHVQRVAALPAVARTIERERLQLNLFKA